MPKESFKIMLVEDNPGDVGLLEHALRQVPGLGYTLAQASELRDLGELLRKGVPDVLLLDLNLPDSRGMRTVDQAVASAIDVPIIVMTSLDDEDLGREAVRHGAQDYLVKGEADGWQLVRAIRYAIERKRTQMQLHQASEELERRVQQRTGELRAIASHALLAEHRERRRLARLVHDRLREKLAAAQSDLGAIHDGTKGDVHALVGKVRQLVEEAILDSWSVTMELSPLVLYESGFVAALRWLAEEMRRTHGLDVSVEADAETPADSAGVCSMLFQMVRELLLNVVEHAKVGPTEVLVRRIEGEQMEVIVSGEWVGLEAGQLSTGSGLGLVNIRRRLELLGGSLEIDTTPGQGGALTISVGLTQLVAGDSQADGPII